MTTLGRWWVHELSAMLAPSLATAAQARRLIVLTPDPDGIRGLIEEPRQAASIDGWPQDEMVPVGELAAMLGSLPSLSRRLPVTVRVPAEAVHSRTVILPAAARKDFARLLTLELVRSTPMKPAELFHAFRVDGRDAKPGMLVVQHYLVKRRLIAPITAAIEAAGMKLGGIECWDQTRSAAQPLAFVPVGESPAGRTSHRLEMALAVLALGLGLSATATHWLRKEQSAHDAAALVATLESRAAIARRALQQATSVGAEIDRVRVVFESRPPALKVLEEATRLMPDDAWVEELRLDGDQLEIAGLAREGTRLLSIFEASPLFRDTQFTAPLSFEPAESKERFRLRTRLRPAATSASKAAEGAR